MNITILPNVSRDRLEGITFDISHSYEADGIRVSWQMTDAPRIRSFAYRIQIPSTDITAMPTADELVTTGELMIPSLLFAYQHRVECYDSDDFSEPLAYIVIEDLAEIDQPIGHGTLLQSNIPAE